MAEYKLKAGASIDLLTKGELDSSLDAATKAMVGEWTERGRGVKVIRNVGRPLASISTTTGYTPNWTPSQGYVWNLRFAGATLSSASNALFNLGTDTNTEIPAVNALIPLGASSTSALVTSVTFGSGNVWVYPGEFVVISAAASVTLNSYMLIAVEVPAELVWKLT